MPHSFEVQLVIHNTSLKRRGKILPVSRVLEKRFLINRLWGKPPPPDSTPLSSSSLSLSVTNWAAGLQLVHELSLPVHKLSCWAGRLPSSSERERESSRVRSRELILQPVYQGSFSSITHPTLSGFSCVSTTAWHKYDAYYLHVHNTAMSSPLSKSCMKSMCWR